MSPAKLAIMDKWMSIIENKQNNATFMDALTSVVNAQLGIYIQQYSRMTELKLLNVIIFDAPFFKRDNSSISNRVGLCNKLYGLHS